MRRYSSILGLMAIITAMMILQVETQEVGASSSTTISQCGQTEPGLGELSGMPDLKTADWSGKTSVENRNDNGIAAVMYAAADEESSDEEGGHGSEAGGEAGTGGFDRLWDVALNG
ncbi:MAG: hypothetical protein ACLQT6_17920 [Desulfomonilaceae bacterium]